LMENPGMSRKEVWKRFNKDPEQVKQTLRDKWINEGNMPEWLDPPFYFSC
jgi:hypothetical protein